MRVNKLLLYVRVASALQMYDAQERRERVADISIRHDIRVDVEVGYAAANA